MDGGARVRRILHCDMDCFYAAVHMRDDPSLQGRPVVVGGSPEGRGVVAAASYEARRFGVHSAMPSARARRQCPGAVFIAPDFPRYRQESERIFDIYREITPLVQTVSLDEAYLDVTAVLEPWGTATAIARAIRQRVREERALTVSVGVGPSKLVAKIASDFRKPDGLTVVPPERVEAFLAPLPVRRLHGVGPATEHVLHGMRVVTVADLRSVPLERLRARFHSWGRTLYEFARGIDDRPVRPERERKSVSEEETFPRDIRDVEQLHGELERLAGEVSVGLRRRDLMACTITIKVRYGDFTTVTRSRTIRVPTAQSERLSGLARELLRRTEAGRRPVRLLGVGASSLVPATFRQGSLFEEEA